MATLRAVTDTTLLSVKRWGTQTNLSAGAGETLTVMNKTTPSPNSLGVPLYHVKVVANDFVVMTGPEQAAVDAARVQVEPVVNNERLFRVAGPPTAADDVSKGHLDDDTWKDTSASPSDYYRLDDAATGAWELIGSGAAGGTERPQEVLTSQVITGTDTALTDTLDFTPVDGTSIVITQNGAVLEQGAGKDYTLASKTVTWLASSGNATDLAATDTLIVLPYRSSD